MLAKITVCRRTEVIYIAYFLVESQIHQNVGVLKCIDVAAFGKIDLIMKFKPK